MVQEAVLPVRVAAADRPASRAVERHGDGNVMTAIPGSGHTFGYTSTQAQAGMQLAIVVGEGRSGGRSGIGSARTLVSGLRKDFATIILRERRGG